MNFKMLLLIAYFIKLQFAEKSQLKKTLLMAPNACWPKYFTKNQ
jgi:hypothetical protein